MHKKLETHLCSGVARSGDDAVDIRQFRLAERKAFEIFYLLADQGIGEFAKNIRRGRPLNSDIDPAIGAGFCIPHITNRGVIIFLSGFAKSIIALQAFNAARYALAFGSFEAFTTTINFSFSCR